MVEESSGPALQYKDISLGTRSGATPGHLVLRKDGLQWRRNSGGRDENISKDEIEAVFWTHTSRGHQFSVRRVGKPTINFLGFKERDRESLASFCLENLEAELADVQMSTSGRNWGSLLVNGTSLMFQVEKQPAFEVPIPDVSQAQPGKEELMLEFHVDDTIVQDNEDALVEIAFHIPDENPDYKEEDGQPASRAFYDQIVNFTDAPTATDDVVVSFDDVGIEVPRGRFVVEMHMSFMRLMGQTQDFKIRYSSIHRLLLLPRPGTPYFNVIVSLDPPIRKGQTFYPFIICRFGADDQVEYSLDMTQEQMEKKNAENGGKLAQDMAGLVHEVFAQIMRGLYGAKITRASKTFRSKEGQPAVRCAYKADDGFLYPLERAFYYGHKPPILVPHEDVVNVEFMRQGGGVQSVTARTFDLLVRLRTDTEHQFRNISRTEWDALLAYLQEKNIRIENLNQAKAGPAGPTVRSGLDVDGGDIDVGMAAYQAGMGEEEDEEDDDFEGGESEESSSDESSDESDAEMVAEGNIGPDLSSKKRAKPGPSSGSKPKGEKKEDKSAQPKEEGPPKKRGRTKKEKGAPKSSMSAYMWFMKENREQVVKDNPEAKQTDIIRLGAEQWKQLGDEAKKKFEEMAKQDKVRYAKDMEEWKRQKAEQGAEEVGGGEAEAEAEADADE